MHPIALLRYLRLPLHTAPLLMIVIFSGLLTMGEHFGLFGLPILVIIGSWFLKYGFALLDDVIEGRRDPPVLSAEMTNPVEQRPFGLFLLLILFYFVTAMLQSSIGDTAVTALRVLLLAMVPSMVASMSVTGRFIDALNPVAVLGTIARIPIAYITLLIVIGALWFIGIRLMQSAGNLLPSSWSAESFLPGQIFLSIGIRNSVTGLFALMLFMYLWLAMFACIGGTMYERRRELDIDAAASPERIAARVSVQLERERDKIMDRIFAEVRGSAFANAGETVRKLIEQAPQPLDECRWLYARAAATPDQRLANYLAQLMLSRLLAVRATGEALRITRERLTTESDFKPQTGGELLQLVQLARDAGDRIMARRLIADFILHFPNDAMASVVAKLQAELER